MVCKKVVKNALKKPDYTKYCSSILQSAIFMGSDIFGFLVPKSHCDHSYGTATNTGDIFKPLGNRSLGQTYYSLVVFLGISKCLQISIMYYYI
jgi:hypothetical protein